MPAQPPAPPMIEAYPNTLSRKQCEALIKRFEDDPNRMPSRTQRGVNPDIRSGTMLDTGELAGWADFVDDYTKAVSKNLATYADKYRSIAPLVTPGKHDQTPPLIERIDPGQGFNWHIDAGPAGTASRIVSSLLYLKDVAEGGATEFPYQQVAIKPTAGLMVLFPPFWTHLHRGAPPISGTKYNVTNFICLTEG